MRLLALFTTLSAALSLGAQAQWQPPEWEEVVVTPTPAPSPAPSPAPGPGSPPAGKATSGPAGSPAVTGPTLKPGAAGLQLWLRQESSSDAGLCPGSRLAKLEPARGLLLGTYVDEVSLNAKTPLNLGQLGPDAFAVLFRYWRLSPAAGPSLVFPDQLAQAAREHGQAIHIALEPSVPLAQLTPATYERFARAAGAAGVPVFVRFASEMNDPRNEWSRDPARYVASWKALRAALSRYAPKAAMVWMPMATTLASAKPYYPGASQVDWVGLSLYGMPFANGDAAQDSTGVRLLDRVAPFYQAYACAHPIQLSEFGTSARSGVYPERDYSALAAQQLREVYWGAQWRFPRLKNINWLHINMHESRFITQKDPRRFNDYSLLSAPLKREAFLELQQSSYFLRRAASCLRCPAETLVSWPAQIGRGLVRGQAWSDRILAPRLAGLSLTLDGDPAFIEQQLPHRFEFDARYLAPGPHTLTLQAIDLDGAVIETRTVRFQVP